MKKHFEDARLFNQSPFYFLYKETSVAGKNDLLGLDLNSSMEEEDEGDRDPPLIIAKVRDDLTSVPDCSANT